MNGVITPNADNTSSLGNSTYRWSAVYAANGTIQTSDARLKSNVTNLNYGLSDIVKLRPVSFTWTAQPEQGTKLGFIAQEVQTIMPETVTVGDDANHTLGITYTEFIPAIVKAISADRAADHWLRAIHHIRCWQLRTSEYATNFASPPVQMTTRRSASRNPNSPRCSPPPASNPCKSAGKRR